MLLCQGIEYIIQHLPASFHLLLKNKLNRYRKILQNRILHRYLLLLMMLESVDSYPFCAYQKLVQLMHFLFHLECSSDLLEFLMCICLMKPGSKGLLIHIFSHYLLNFRYYHKAQIAGQVAGCDLGWNNKRSI